jgi:hypothetical protein
MGVWQNHIFSGPVTTKLNQQNNSQHPSASLSEFTEKMLLRFTAFILCL